MVRGIVIRDVRESDAQIITEEEIAQGWENSIEKYEMRLEHQREGKCISLAAKWNGYVAGHIHVDPASLWGAFSYSDGVYLGAGLHSGYGSAQRLYVKREYIPDGGGVWYKDQVLKPYADCRSDDDLVLYLYKHQKKE